MNGNYPNRSRSIENHSNRNRSNGNRSNGNRSNRNSLNGNSSNENISNGNHLYGNILNGNLSDGNISNGNISNGNLSDGNLSNGNISNGNISDGNISDGNHLYGNILNGNLSDGNLSNGNHLYGNILNGNHLNGNLSDGNLSNGPSHSSAPQTDWKNLFRIKTNWLENCQAELQDSQLKCLQVQEQLQELQESYKELRVAWQNLWTEQEKDWQLRAETARAFQEFQTAYEEERKQQLPTERARQSFHDNLQRGLQSGNETAQNTARDSNPFNFHLGRDPFENLTQLAMPNQSPPLRSALNPVAPVFSTPRDDPRAHSADSAYYYPSSQEARNGNEPEMHNDSGTANSSNASSIFTPSAPPNPSQTQFRIPRMQSEFPRRHHSDSYLTDMRAGRASTPE
ncbi:hypothetical protein BHYA_0087g00140 [Botrytis hyacinthi]|uniref:Uncharacterized protein n=1 Tax=Botrytis hyacinthi TaxID=278943 RepID=A0A4Z1GLV9_9HELO|nr:hypothetical protein BHYA_0087g00140 [Botrytis hyacinthi]